MNAIKTFSNDSPEYERLVAAAALMTVMSPSRTKFTVETTYFDYGANWRYTTIIAHNDGDRWQALCPIHQEGIVYGDLIATVNQYATEGHFKW